MANLLREGMRTAISCQILEGDLPIDFTWLKNNQSINENDLFDIQIRRLDEYSSSLIIDQINSSHNGDYTCIASNLAGSDNVTVPLTVNGMLFFWYLNTQTSVTFKSVAKTFWAIFNSYYKRNRFI